MYARSVIQSIFDIPCMDENINKMFFNYSCTYLNRNNILFYSPCMDENINKTLFSCLCMDAYENIILFSTSCVDLCMDNYFSTIRAWAHI